MAPASPPIPPAPGPTAAPPDPPRSVLDAGQVAAPAGLDARYEQLRDAVLHDRARAFPFGLGILIGKGVTAWHRLLTHLSPSTPRTSPDPTRPPTEATHPGSTPGLSPDVVPQVVAAQLVHALAAVAVALAGT